MAIVIMAGLLCTVWHAVSGLAATVLAALVMVVPTSRFAFGVCACGTSKNVPIMHMISIKHFSMLHASNTLSVGAQ